MDAATDDAKACVDGLRGSGRDPHLLFLLEAKGWDGLDETKAGYDLRVFLEAEMRLTRMQVSSQGFHDRVRELLPATEIPARGMVAGVGKMAVAFRYNEVLEQASKEWAAPSLPFVIQLMRPGGKCGAFVGFPSWETGFMQHIRISAMGCFEHRGSRIPVQVVYEKQVGDGRLFIDFDAKLKEFEGFMTQAQLEQCMEDFPLWFWNRLVEIEAISQDDVVYIWRKNKSREGKVSCHFNTNICVNPSTSGRRVLEEAFHKMFSGVWTEQKRTGTWVHVGKPFPPGALADPATMHGNNQFSMLFGGKPGERLPRLDRCYAFRRGIMEELPLPWGSDVNAPDHPLAFQMLRAACFSNPIEGMVTVSKKFRMGARHESRTRDNGPPRAKKLGGPVAQDHFMIGVLRDGMPCLKKKKEELMRVMPEAEGMDAFHVQSDVIMCPSHALAGREHYHKSNGLYVVKPKEGRGEVLYARCTNCSDIKVDLDRALVKPVEGTETWRFPWAIYTAPGLLPKNKKPRG